MYWKAIGTEIDDKGELYKYDIVKYNTGMSTSTVGSGNCLAYLLDKQIHGTVLMYINLLNDYNYLKGSILRNGDEIDEI